VKDKYGSLYLDKRVDTVSVLAFSTVYMVRRLWFALLTYVLQETPHLVV